MTADRLQSSISARKSALAEHPGFQSEHLAELERSLQLAVLLNISTAAVVQIGRAAMPGVYCDWTPSADCTYEMRQMEPCMHPRYAVQRASLIAAAFGVQL